VLSTLIPMGEHASTPLDVGYRENLFWIGPQVSWGTTKPHIHWDDKIAVSDFPEGKYIKRGRFACRAVAKFMLDPTWREQFASYENMTQQLPYQLYLKGETKDYETKAPVMLEPNSTHRWEMKKAKILFEEKIAPTQNPTYSVYDRLNGASGLRSSNGQDTANITYHNEDLPLLNNMAVLSLRGYLRSLVSYQRNNPSQFVGVEPVHEMEIVSAQQGNDSLGDYNPEGLKHFYHHLMMLHGDLMAINKAYGTPFSDSFFDAPRALGRGAWDEDSSTNSFYQAWWHFNAHVINRVNADGYREALLAGFPPESISAHQIPDLYAIGRTDNFTAPDRRVTPVDWLMNSGVGYGFTRYGVHFDKEHTAIKSGWSSGFGMMSLGEYAPMTTDVDKAYRNLVNLVDHGAYFIHHMAWDPTRWPGQNKAAFEACQRLLKERDQPRASVAGSVSKVVPYRDATHKRDLVAIGTGPERTGLIKSITGEGAWDGCVYVVPFHSALDIKTLASYQGFQLPQAVDLWAPETTLLPGSQFELSFWAQADSPTHLSLQTVAAGVALPQQVVELGIGTSLKHYRIVFKFQVEFENVTVRMMPKAEATGMKIEHFSAYRHQEQSARLRKGIFEGKRHRGGVMFDVLPPFLDR
jgi:hypothetical protein